MAAANIPLTGIVNTQAVIRLLVIPHRTAERRLVAPTPIIAPVMVWVVLTGIFRYSVRYNVNAPAVSAITPLQRSYFGNLSSHGFHNLPST